MVASDSFDELMICYAPFLSRGLWLTSTLRRTVRPAHGAAGQFLP